VSNADRSAAIRDILASVTAPVRLLFFEQSIGCESCTPTRQVLEQLADLSPNLTVERLNLVLEQERAAQYGVDRVPAIVVSSPRRERIRFYGAPLGHELMSLLDAIRMTSSGDSGFTEQIRAQLAAVNDPVRIQVFFTPTCAYCPQMVTLANRLAIESPQISATAINATEYPDLVHRYNVNGVPKTVINDAAEIVGAVAEADLIREVLKQSGIGHRESGVDA
jgi:glutaredoxin-like protein